MDLSYLRAGRLLALSMFLPDAPEGGGGVEPAPEPQPVADPAAKPFSDLSADEKVEFLLAKTRRLEDASKGKTADPDARALRARVKELEKHEQTVRDLEEASRTEAEKAVLKAKADGEKVGREAALAEARKTYGSQLVAVKLDAAAAGKGMTAEQIRKAAGDLSRFLGDEGVDDGEVADFLSALPDKAAATAPVPLTPNAFGAGNRQTPKVDGLTQGEDIYAQRHKKKTSA
jgi:hypothetical protein